MKVYLVNAETNEIIETFENVTTWGENFVEYLNGGYPGKVYCRGNEYFTDQEVIVEEQE